MSIAKVCTTALVTLLVTGLPVALGYGSALALPPAPTQAQDARKAEADRLFNQGFEQFQTSQFEAALQSWQQALALYREIKDRQSEGQTLNNLGLAYRNLGDPDQAIRYHQQALAIARKIKDRESEGKALGNLGLAYDSLGAYDQAISYHQQHLTIAREIKDRQSEGNALGNLGNAYDSLGAYDQAINYHQQHLTIAREIKDRQSEGKALGNLGIAYKNLGAYDQAIGYYQQHLAIAREIKDRQSEGKALGNLGNTYKNLGAYAKAISYEQQHLTIAREIKDRQGEGIALNNLGETLYRSGQVAAAEQPLLDAIAVREKLRQGLSETNQLSLIETQRNPYLNLQQVKVALKKPQEALEIAERGRARVFVEQLCKRSATAPSCTNIPAISLAQMQQVARTQQATLVEYSIIPDGKPTLYIWVVQPSGEIKFEQTPLTIIDSALTPAGPNDRGGSGTRLAEVIRGGTSTKIAEVVRSTREQIGATGRNTVTPTQVNPAAETKRLQALYQQLIAPIAAYLPTDSEQPVIFIPQGPFFQVPFAALLDAEKRSLIEKHTILTAPSIQVLAAISQSHPNQVATGANRALIVGNPALTSVILGPGQAPQLLVDLPGSKREAEQIATLFKTQPLLGKAATKAAVMQRLGQASVIHLATHGFLDDVTGVGVPGAIALTPTTNPPDDGLLTANDLFTQKLQADLVVLSACDTGQGRITGDGVIGLSRALLFAGTPSVIVSLWKVPDAPTAALMQAFYQQWLAHPEQGKARALRYAMRKVKKTYPEPLAWAAFTLIGVAK